MDVIDQLKIVIQISISLAGFSGIVASFQYRDSSKITRGDTLGLVMLVNMSLADTFFSILPIALFNFSLNQTIVWGISSGLIAMNYTVFLFYIWSRLKYVKVRRTITKIAHYLWLILCISIIVINVLNSIGIIFHREYPPYFISLLLPLIAGGYLFARLVSRPLWRAIRQQEKEETSKGNV